MEDKKFGLRSDEKAAVRRKRQSSEEPEKEKRLSQEEMEKRSSV